MVLELVMHSISRRNALYGLTLLVPSFQFGATSRSNAAEKAPVAIKGYDPVAYFTDGKAGTVESVSLNELHGLRISINGHDGEWLVSTIKFTQQA
jgi:hypothetical protein